MSMMRALDRLSASLTKRGFTGVIGAALADLWGALQQKLVHIRDHACTHRFINRSTDSNTLIIVLAGYKPYLWQATLTRLTKYAPKDVDLCIVSSGLHSAELVDQCSRNGWSYLSVSRNSPGVALNRAIKLHPKADYIFKLDEDIFVGSGFFDLMREGYDKAQQTWSLEPGFCAPALNVNGITYRTLLKKLNLEAEYVQTFGEPIMRCGGLPVHSSPEAALWLWIRSLPFDNNVAKFSRDGFHGSICATRFSIGAILFRREFIDSVFGFKSAWHSGVLGIDEDFLCRDCVSQSRPMYLIENVFAGHFSFYPQESLMRQKLSDLSHIDPITFPAEHYGTQN